MDPESRHRITAKGTVGGIRSWPLPLSSIWERKRLDLANSNIPEDVPREGDRGQDNMLDQDNQQYYVVEHLSCPCSIA
jgi:hypothetical protein